MRAHVKFIYSLKMTPGELRAAMSVLLLVCGLAYSQVLSLLWYGDLELIDAYAWSSIILRLYLSALLVIIVIRAFYLRYRERQRKLSGDISKPYSL